MLFWSFCLLTFVQCVAGLIVRGLFSSEAIMSHFDEIVTEHGSKAEFSSESKYHQANFFQFWHAPLKCC